VTDSATRAPTAPGAGPDAAMGAGTAIRTEDLRKTYKTSRGDVPAVRGIDLNVPSGELFGLLGPNGAGKSTTIGMLTTLVLPTGGRAWVAGLDVAADPVGVKRRIGVVTQNNTLDMQLTVAENLEFRSRFFGLGPREAARRAGQLIDAFGLGDRRDAMATDLSGGQARRLLIARALVHRPEVLFLDEPTAGLDPQTRVNLWDILRVLHDQGQSILLTTHYMEEADTLCDRVAIMDHGQIRALDTPAELKRRVGADTVVTVTADGDLDQLERLLADEVPGVNEAHRRDGSVQLHVRGSDGLLPRVITAAEHGGFNVTDLSVAEPTLETVFITLTGKDLRD
jgi:daunorubicin resistance ABC transporter ATP-binding subunit